MAVVECSRGRVQASLIMLWHSQRTRARRQSADSEKDVSRKPISSRDSAYLVELLLFSLGEPLFQGGLVLRIEAWFWSVTNEELILNRVIEVTCALENLDVDLQENREPP